MSPSLRTGALRLVREIVSLAAVLCAALLLVILDRRGIIGGWGWLSPATLLILSLVYLRHFRVSLPIYPTARRAALLTAAIAGALLLPTALWAWHPLTAGGAEPLPLAHPAHLALLVPLAEELYFRGLLLDHLRRGWGTWRAVLICTALFGFLHLQAGSAPSAAVLSLAACLLVVYGGSLAFAVQLHVAWNAFSFVQRAPDAAERWTCVALIAVAIIGIAVVLLAGTAHARRCRQNSMRAS